MRHLLVEWRIHRVPVLRGREAIGVVSRGDILAAFAHSTLAPRALKET